MAKALVPNIEVLFFGWPFDGFRADVYDHDAARGLDAAVAANLRREFGADFKFLLLRHPTSRARDIFHHSVFGHELAHVAIELPAPVGLPAEVADRPVDDGEQRQRTWSNVATDGVSMSGFNSPQRELLLDWFNELACDVFAMRLVGPAFAIAFTEVTAPNRRLEPGKKARSHPPNSLRFALLREELQRFTFEPRGAALGPVLDGYLSSFPAHTDSETELPGGEAWLRTALDRFRQNLPHQLGTLEYTPEDLARDLPLVFELADADIPPAERLVVFEPPDPGNESATGAATGAPIWSKPIDWRSILNGLYFWHLSDVPFPDTHLGEDPRAIATRAHQREQAIRLTVGAVELSEFHLRASKLRAAFKDMTLLDLSPTRGALS